VSNLAGVNVRLILPSFLPVSMGVVSFEYVACAVQIDFPMTPLELYAEGPRLADDGDPPPTEKLP
jgi:hypothetical protein